MATTTPVSDDTEPRQTSFAETALDLGGKSAEEARRTGAIDTADDQVEALLRRNIKQSTARPTGPCGIAACRSNCS